jgi:hypothetical protein
MTVTKFSTSMPAPRHAVGAVDHANADLAAVDLEVLRLVSWRRSLSIASMHRQERAEVRGLASLPPIETRCGDDLFPANIE